MQKKVKENYYEGQPVYAGIDYHKKNWKVSIMGEHYEYKTFTQNPDPNILARYLNRNFPGGDYYAVYEAGFSGFGSCRKLRELGINCSVIHPADVPTNQKERLQKTDKVDSRKLARALRNRELIGIDIPDEELEADRALVRQRFRVMKDLTRIKNRVRSLMFQFGIAIPERFTNSQARHWSKPYITWLTTLDLPHESVKLTLNNYISFGQAIRQELLLINRQVRSLTKLPRYKQNYELLLTVPGVGLMTAITFLVQIGDIGRFKKLDELCSYVGLIPSMHSSGDRTLTGKMIKRGRKMMKIMLIEASWTAIRNDPVMMIRFSELTKHMNKNKAIIRIARKLLNRIRYVLKNQQNYEIGVVA